jgi:glycosyltransferase involved in cell wall biosynthesis
MIGPCTSGKGGIATVIRQYEENHFFSALNSQYWVSWSEKSDIGKVAITFKVAAKLILALFNRKISAIHVQSSCRGSFLRKSLFIAIGNVFGVPAIFHLHSGEFFKFYDRSYNPLFRWWVRSTLNRSAAIVLLTESWRPLTLPLVRQPGKIRVISNPMGLHLPANFSRSPRIPGQLNLLFLGEIGNRKGIFDLLPVIATLRKKGLNIRLRCAGNGQVERLQVALKELALEEAVDFIGWINYDQKIREFAAADAFILPSHYEGQPMAILEAMMAGLLVISTTAGGIPDTIVNEREGLLVSPGDQNAMQRVLERVYTDLHCADELVANAKRRIENENSPQSVLAKLIDIYKDIKVLD